MRRPVHLGARSIDTYQAALVCALLWAGVGLAGCSFDARDCTLDSPCPSDRVCDSATGICEPLDSDASNQSDSEQPDSGQPDDASNTDADPIDRFDATPDTNEPQDSGPISGVCLVDRFTDSCQEDQHELNDTNTAATRLVSGRVGCDHNDDELVTFDTETRVSICPGDRDWYTYDTRTCRHRSFIVEVFVTPHEPCDPRSYVIEWRVNNDSKARCEDPAQDGTPNWQCQALADGGKKLSYIVDSERFPTIYRHTVTVEASELTDGEDIQFDYDLRARIKP